MGSFTHGSFHTLVAFNVCRFAKHPSGIFLSVVKAAAQGGFRILGNTSAPSSMVGNSLLFQRFYTKSTRLSTFTISFYVDLATPVRSSLTPQRWAYRLSRQRWESRCSRHTIAEKLPIVFMFVRFSSRIRSSVNPTVHLMFPLSAV